MSPLDRTVRTIKTLALVLAVMPAMVLTPSEAVAQQGVGAHGRLRATARVIKLVLPPAQLSNAIAEMVSDSIPNRRVLPSGVHITVIEAPGHDSTPTTDIFAGRKACCAFRDRLPVKVVLVEYAAN